MVVLAAAVVPHPPLLVPELAAGAAGLVAPLLAACDEVVTGLLARSPQTVVLIGSGQHTGPRAEAETGTLAGFGTGLGTSGSGTSSWGTTELLSPAQQQLSLIIGRWLLERAGWTGGTVLYEVAVDTPAEDAELLGVRLAAETGPDSVWLALGDGSTRRGPRSPGHDDPRAAGFDAEVVRAFATGDRAALLGLDADLAAELGVGGRAVWQVLASAVGAAGWAGIEATVHYDAAPFGVEYLVADWRPVS